MNARAINHHTYQMATELLRVVENCIAPNERRDAWEEFVEVIRQGLTRYETAVERQRKRLNPSEN
jgi:hypothetical protein